MSRNYTVLKTRTIGNSFDFQTDSTWFNFLVVQAELDSDHSHDEN